MRNVLWGVSPLVAFLALGYGLTGVQDPTVVKLEVTGLPEGADRTVTVVLPDGSSQEVSDPAAFAGSAAGNYRVAAITRRVAGDVVDLVYVSAAATVTAEAEKTTTLRVSFVKRGGTGMLWAASERIREDDDFSVGEIRGVAGSTLEGGSIGKEVRTASPARGQQSLVDGSGRLLVMDAWEGRVASFPPAQLRAGGVFGSHSGEDLGADSMALDLDGNLWLVRGDSLRKVAAGSLGSGTYVVSTTITPPEGGAGFGYPVFSAEGDLFLVSGVGIWRIPKANLGASGEARGSFMAMEVGTTGQAAFDKDGNLWVTDENGAILKIDKGSLAGSGALSPTVTGAPQSVYGLAFDNSGRMYFSVRYTGEVFRREASDLESDGGTRLGVFTDAAMYSTLTFNPPPAWSPLAKVKGMP